MTFGIPEEALLTPYGRLAVMSRAGNRNGTESRDL